MMKINVNKLLSTVAEGIWRKRVVNYILFSGQVRDLWKNTYVSCQCQDQFGLRNGEHKKVN